MNANSNDSLANESSSTLVVEFNQEELNRIQHEIRKQSNNALLAGALGLFFPFFGIIAIFCGRTAVRLIEKHAICRDCYRRARRGITLGYFAIGVLFFTFLVGIIAIVGAIMIVSLTGSLLGC